MYFGVSAIFKHLQRGYYISLVESNMCLVLLNVDMANNYAVYYVAAKDVTGQIIITLSNVTCCI